MGVELPSCIVVTLSWNALTCSCSQAEYKIVFFYLLHIWKIFRRHDFMGDFRAMAILVVRKNFKPLSRDVLHIIVLKHLTWVLQIYYLFCEIFKFCNFIDKNNF